VRRAFVAVLVVFVLAVGAACESGSGSSSGTSSGDSSSGSSAGDSNGTSASGNSGDEATSDGGTSRNDGSSGGSSGGSSHTTPKGSPGIVPPNASAPPPPSGFTLPEPDANGNVRVPEEPPQEVRDDPPRKRLSELPPVPRSCLDDDLTLLDVFAPFVSVPVRLMYCLVYVGTIARLPSEINITVRAPSLDGPDISVGLLAPHTSQRPLATLALIILLVVVALLVGYALGRRGNARA
jgi:hypothetical protein